MFVRLGKLFVIFALVAATNAHWAVLQSVAWTTMFADNLRTHSAAEAVAQTFDGKHPCSLCKAIAAGKKSEKRTEFPLPLQKLEYPPAPARLILVAPARFQPMPLVNTFAELLALQPPTPPPRGNPA
jgi:hypothetical protein